jgi:hypothetical protein
MQHVSHLGFGSGPTDSGGPSTSAIPQEFMEVFKEANITEEQLKDPETCVLALSSPCLAVCEAEPWPHS